MNGEIGMAPIAIFFGLLLSGLGPILYLLSDPAKQSLTAFIPTGFGIVLILCGVLAFNDKLRMHVMHLAALLGLIGFAMPAIMVPRAILNATEEKPVNPLSVGGQAVMGALCLVFLILCVKSFIDVRMARKKKEAETQAGSIPPR
jgi:hypothetical protein